MKLIAILLTLALCAEASACPFVGARARARREARAAARAGAACGGGYGYVARGAQACAACDAGWAVQK